MTGSLLAAESEKFRKNDQDAIVGLFRKVISHPEDYKTTLEREALKTEFKDILSQYDGKLDLSSEQYLENFEHLVDSHLKR